MDSWWQNYEDRCALGAIRPTAGQMSQRSPRTGNAELQFIVKGTPKTPQYRPALRPRVRGKLRLRYFEAILQVNTYTMSKRAGGCLQRNVFILSLKHSPALASQFSSLINQVCKWQDVLCHWCLLLRRQLSSHINLFSLTSLKATQPGTQWIAKNSHRCCLRVLQAHGWRAPWADLVLLQTTAGRWGGYSWYLQEHH